MNKIDKNMFLKKVRYKGVDFEVSECGKVIRNNGKILKQTLNGVTEERSGYYIVSISNKRIPVHQIVAEAYVINPKIISYKNVLFKDNNSLNTHKDNLYYGDRKMIALKRRKINTEISYRGNSPIPYEEALKIAKRLDAGESAKDIATEYNVSEMSISRIRKKYANQKTISVRYSKDTRRIAERLLQKYSVKEVSITTRIPYETIWRWNKKIKTSTSTQHSIV